LLYHEQKRKRIVEHPMWIMRIRSWIDTKKLKNNANEKKPAHLWILTIKIATSFTIKKSKCLSKDKMGP